MPEVSLIERVEGHVKVEVEEGEEGINFRISEGPRLYESFLEGRKYDEVSFFSSRICGFCPIVHNLSAIKALEKALDITPSETVTKFRRALNSMEFVQSHSAHLYVLTLPDYVDSRDDLFSVRSKFPEEVKRALKLRRHINEMIETLGGRTVHPLTTRVGGFSRVPSEEELEDGIKKLEEMKPIAEETVDLIASLDYPEFGAETRYLALGRDDDIYPTYDGYVISSEGEKFEPEEYSEIIEEETRPYSTAKFSTIDGEPFLVGALPRMNLNRDKLSPDAKRKLEGIEIEFPSNNPYHNNVAQAIEIITAIDEIKEIYSELLSENTSGAELLGRDLTGEIDIEVKAGEGTDSVEAPRGTLYHHYKLNNEGFVEDVDILTPTAQSAANIERDINLRWSELEDLSRGEKENKIKALVRAYDPCLSCSVH